MAAYMMLMPTPMAATTHIAFPSIGFGFLIRSKASISRTAVRIQIMKTDIRAARTSARWYPKEWRLVAGCSESQMAINDTMKLTTSDTIQRGAQKKNFFLIKLLEFDRNWNSFQTVGRERRWQVGRDEVIKGVVGHGVHKR